MKITFISDTHTKHKNITQDLPGGDLLIHAGDISSMGYEHEIQQFCKWFDKIDNYDHKIFIAGNHDWGFQNNVENAMQIVNSYKTIDYLQDDWFKVIYGEQMVKVYGSPWQPEFYNWAFNLPRMGKELDEKWSLIPEGLDVLVTHGPPWGMLDMTPNNINVGCELLQKKVIQVKPKIHVFGHIHSSYGQKTFDGVEYINASVLGENYKPKNKPVMIDYNLETKEFDYV